MSIETLPEKQPNQETKLEETYINPETLDIDTLELVLKEGEVLNIHPIEEHNQKVPPHADRVLLGDIIPHADQLFEAEIQIPGENKKLLVVYKPENGINKGTYAGGKPQLPKESSPYGNKESAAWIVAKNLNLTHIAEPVVIRSLNEGLGSVRPYIWGEPLEILPEEKIEAAFADSEIVEDFALYDYILQNLDRRLSNIILEESDGLNRLKAIDHSLTFFTEEFASRYEKKGPRLLVAFDNSTDPPTLKKTPLPERLRTKIEESLGNEQEIRRDLSELLTEEEIDGIFNRAQKLFDKKIFL